MLIYVNILGKYIYAVRIVSIFYSEIYSIYNELMVSMDICDRKCNSGD